MCCASEKRTVWFTVPRRERKSNTGVAEYVCNREFEHFISGIGTNRIFRQSAGMLVGTKHVVRYYFMLHIFKAGSQGGTLCQKCMIIAQPATAIETRRHPPKSNIISKNIGIPKYALTGERGKCER